MTRAQTLVMTVVCLIPLRAVAQEEAGTDEQKAPADAAPVTDAAKAETAAAGAKSPARAQPQPENGKPPEPPAPEPSAWHTEIPGYFRAPISLGVSSRPSPDDPNGPSKTQIAYGPNRVFDWNYFCFV